MKGHIRVTTARGVWSIPRNIVDSIEEHPEGSAIKVWTDPNPILCKELPHEVRRMLEREEKGSTLAK